MHLKKSQLPDITADPFRERIPAAFRRRFSLLGGNFEFACQTAQLRRLAERAYADLPAHRLPGVAPHFRVTLALAPRTAARARGGPPRIDMLSGAGLLCGTTSASDFAVISPEQHSALVVVSRDLLRFPDIARYELIEFAVYTLAARVQGLMPLHAACVGRQGRGLLLVGDSGAGKSTAALHCALRGMEVLSEDSVFVTPHSLLATAVPNFLHVRCDSVQSLPPACAALIRRSPVIRRRSGIEKFELDVRRAAFRLAPGPLRVTRLVFISARAAPRGTLLAPLPVREALARLQSSQSFAASQPGWETLRKRIAAIPAFELCRGRHATEAGEALQGLLTRGRHGARP